MTTFDDPTYVYDFRSTLNCATTQGATPGQEIDVLVRPDGQPDAPAVRARGTRSADGHSFTIIVTTIAGTQSHTWGWEALQNAIRVHRGTPG